VNVVKIEEVHLEVTAIIIIIIVQRFNAILLQDSLPTTDGAD